MDAAETLRKVADTVALRMAETGRTPAEVARILEIDRVYLDFPGVLTLGQIIALCVILDAHPADFFPTARVSAGGAA